MSTLLTDNNAAIIQHGFGKPFADLMVSICTTLDTLGGDGSGSFTTVDATTITATGTVGGATVASTGAITAAQSVTVGANYGYIIGSAGSAGGYRNLCYKVSGIADNSATTVASFTIPAGNQAAAFRVLLCATMSGSTDDFESTRVATGTGVINRQLGANAAAAVSAIAQAQIATSGGGTITLAYSITTPTVGAGATDCNLQVTIVKTGTVTGHECVVFIELINSQASGITVSAP